MYYDSGFIIGLKAFVAAIIGGLVSYPLTAVGALAVGLVESFALVLERRAEGRDRLQPADPGAAAALVRSAARRRGRRGDRRMKRRAQSARRWRSWRRDRAGACGARQVHRLAAQRHRHRRAGRARPRAADRRRRRDLVRPGRVRRHRRLRDRVADDGAGRVAVARPRRSRCCSPASRRSLIGVLTLAPRRPLPAAVARSPGACRSRCCSATSMRSAATPASRTCRRCALGAWSLADPRAIYYLIWALVGLACCSPQPAALAPRPRDPQPARRRDAARRASAPTRSGCGSRCSCSPRCSPASPAGSMRTRTASSARRRSTCARASSTC